MKKSRYNRYYAQQPEVKTSFERQIERLMHDPIRLCEGTNENIKIRPVKAVRLG